MMNGIRAALLLAGMMALSGTAWAQAQPVPGSLTPPATVAAQAPRSPLGHGYLRQATLPDDAGLWPAPPAAGSSADRRDREAAAMAVAQRGSARWGLAARDADLFGPEATRALSCAAGFAIGPRTTPRLDALLRRTIADFGLSTAAVKRRYQRPRPFMVNAEPSCTPESEAMLRGDGSYPSGHSAIGYGWSMILAELLPDRAAALVARGRAFGDSRRICNVHWLSDVEEGRVAAAATFARLNADPAFQADLAAARGELAAATAAPPQGCVEEAAALAATR